MARKAEPKTIPPGFEIRNLADVMMECRMVSAQIARHLTTVVEHPDLTKLDASLQVMVRMAQTQAEQMAALFIYRDEA